jgi:uncharacterized membrane protein YgcG
MRLHTILAVALVVGLSGCHLPDQQHHQVAETSTVHVRQVSNSTDNTLLWYYILFSSPSSSTCPCYVASSPTRTSDMSSLSFTRSPSLPSDAGYGGKDGTTTVEKEETEEVATEELPEATQAELVQDEMTDGASEEVEAAPATPAEEPAESQESSSDSSNDTSSDSGSSGGDSGGGDSGGGE